MHDMRIANHKDVKHLFVTPNDSILAALDVIDRGGRKTALVVDKDLRLVGIIADPDIRRALLNGVSLEQPVHTAMNSNPITLELGISDVQARQQLHRHKRDLLPVLDSAGRVVDVALLVEALGVPQMDNAVVLMAGGMGKRLLPLTKDTPKPMLEVGSKPMLETLVENFVAAGFSKFYLSVNYLQEAIESHFGDGSKWGVDISYLYEDEPLGTGGALSLLDKRLCDPFITMNCDVLTKVNFESLLKHHENSGSYGTMCVSQHEVSVPFGVVEHEKFKLKRIVEKPVWNYFVNAGIYVFAPEVLGLLKRGEALDMPHLISRIDKAFGEVSLFPIREYWLDVGSRSALEQARQDYHIHFGEK